MKRTRLSNARESGKQHTFIGAHMECDQPAPASRYISSLGVNKRACKRQRDAPTNAYRCLLATGREHRWMVRCPGSKESADAIGRIGAKK